jgi:hypothetical protein
MAVKEPVGNTGKNTDLTVARILAAGKDTGKGNALAQAEEFLLEELADGPVPVKELQQAAKYAGIAGITLRRAKDSLAIGARKRGQPGGDQSWHWELSKDAHALPEGAQISSDEHLRAGDEHLRPESDRKPGPLSLANLKSPWKRGQSGNGKQIDAHLFEDLCRIQCTKREICGVLNISESTLLRWVKRNYSGATFDTIHEKYSDVGKMSLRRWQMQAAEAGNATMLIWLGKQLLDQKDLSRFEHTVETRTPISIVEVMRPDTGPIPD